MTIGGIKDSMGTRFEIETKLIEFLYNLKFYSTRWLRAKFYAEMAGFLHLAHSNLIFKAFNNPINKDQNLSDNLKPN